MKKSPIKSAREIIAIEKACGLTDQTFSYVLKKIKLGVSEKQISLEIQRFIRKNGAQLAFRPIVAFGKNSAEPHHKANNTKLKTGDIVKLDLGAKINGYCSDTTRTVFFGSANAEFKKIYQVVLEAQSLAIQQFNNLTIKHPRKQIKASEIDKIARRYIISQGFPSIPHSLGHGIGKKVHERPKLSPKSKDTLKQGMAFTIEPGIYLKDFGGIRIEDIFYLSGNKLKQLTHSPKTIIEL